MCHAFPEDIDLWHVTSGTGQPVVTQQSRSANHTVSPRPRQILIQCIMSSEHNTPLLKRKPALLWPRGRRSVFHIPYVTAHLVNLALLIGANITIAIIAEWKRQLPAFGLFLLSQRPKKGREEDETNVGSTSSVLSTGQRAACANLIPTGIP